MGASLPQSGSNQSIDQLTKTIEDSCDKLCEQDNFNINTYLDKLKNKYEATTDDIEDEKKQSQTVNVSLLKREKKQSQTVNLSLLTDLKESAMCPRGHGLDESQLLVMGTEQNHCVCFGCGNQSYNLCHSCDNYDRTYKPDIYGAEHEYIWCETCGAKHAEKIKMLWSKIQKEEQKIIEYYETHPHIATDLLTRLNTKTALEQLLKEIVVTSASGERQSYCLWSLDIDNFRLLNENEGHDGADNKIKQIGAILRSYKEKPADFWSERGICIQRIWAFRPGGDEFCVVTKGIYGRIKTQDGFYELLKKDMNEKVGVNISVGLLVYGGCLEDCTVTNWLKLVDEALYAAKDVDGKNSLRICDGWDRMKGKGVIVGTFENMLNPQEKYTCQQYKAFVDAGGDDVEDDDDSW